jgi:hypothetical protein
VLVLGTPVIVGALVGAGLGRRWWIKLAKGN